MSLYSIDLVNLETNQRNLQNILTEGGFSVNRIGKSFAGVPVNMALEQTISANAKSWLKGIMAFAYISTTVNQWIVSASMKNKILNAVYRLCCMNISYDQLNCVHPE